MQLVRGRLSELSRCTLQALIVLDVHNRDVINEMAHRGIENINDFQWQA